MNVNVRGLAVVVGLVVALHGVAAGQTLYAVTADSENGSLYTIDTATGEATLVGATGVGLIAGLAADDYRTLYVYTGELPDGLYTVNPDTGAATLVGDLGLGFIEEGDLTYQSPSGVLLAADSVDDELLRIDPSTGAATVVGAFGPEGRDVSGLAFDDAGVLYGLATMEDGPDQLVTIAPDTGVALFVGYTGTYSPGWFGGLATDSEGTMFASDGESLYAIDTATGVADVIGPHGIIDISGMAFLAEATDGGGGGNGGGGPPADGDGDGVSDALDQCPDTTAGTEVDEFGCDAVQAIEDDDGDGIANADDACSDTPANEAADANGCSNSQRDDDQDGVLNPADRCVDTIAGGDVDGVGCAPAEADQDDDADGVANADDACPVTPADQDADDEGCSDGQRDDDGDGVANAADECADTPAHTPVGPNGCDLPDDTTGGDNGNDNNGGTPPHSGGGRRSGGLCGGIGMINLGFGLAGLWLMRLSAGPIRRRRPV